MDEIAAAKAMRWNVELDRGLRSLKPGCEWEAILKLGLRLQQWSRESPVSAITASLFKLDPGQDQAFSNAIVLRLMESFRTGDNFTRLCILKVLMLEKKSRNSSNIRGLLTKERVPGFENALVKVKSIMKSGDTIARALALFVIGCLAGLTKGSADMYYLVFEAIDSPFEPEVHAALYALGCFCEVSDSFASLALERLINLVNAIGTPPKTRIHAIHVFARMHLSSSVSLQAFEQGKTLLLTLPMDEVVMATLEALSKLALKSRILCTEQVKLLLSYVCSDPRATVRATSLQCLVKLAKHVKWLHFSDKAVEMLINVVDDAEQPVLLQSLALEALKEGQMTLEKLSPCP